jgi:hypothetical protein
MLTAEVPQNQKRKPDTPFCRSVTIARLFLTSLSGRAIFPSLRQIAPNHQK